MNTAETPKNGADQDHQPSPLAAVLSYLVPGLGQIYQGRVAKGLLFFVCLYGLFFYGLYLGGWQNVYFSWSDHTAPMEAPGLSRVVWTVRDRIMYQIRTGYLGQVWIGAAAWPALLQENPNNGPAQDHPIFGRFQQMPTQDEMIATLQDSDKSPYLGWIYTVIAGVLNILVIYDAYAGPAVGRHAPEPEAAPGEDGGKGGAGQ